MTSLDLKHLSASSKNQLALSLAAFILNSDKKEVTKASLEKVTAASGLKVCVPDLNAFANAIAGKKVDDYTVCACASASAAPAPTKDAAKSDTKAPAKKEEAPKEEEVDFDMGDMFG